MFYLIRRMTLGAIVLLGLLQPTIATAETEEDGIRLGGAVRFQYVLTDYNDGQKIRGGDFDFDIFRLDLDGRTGDVILSAQYRWFNYMQALRHAYIGYDFSEQWQGQIGIVIQPFGVLPYSSHSYFFSSNFYLGFEDNNGAGIKFTKRNDSWDFDIAYILNDELGGAMGAKRSGADRYAYDIVGIRLPGENIFDEPTALAGENNTLMLRVAHKWNLTGSQKLELGASGHYGDFHNGEMSVVPAKALDYMLYIIMGHGKCRANL